MFGPLDEFDAYATAMEKLGGITESVAGQMYDAWASGGELTTKMVRKMIGNEIAAEGKKLLVKGISTTLSSVCSVGGSGGGASSHRGGSQDHRGQGAGAGQQQGFGNGGNTVVVMGDGWADDSRRYRAASFRRAQEGAGRIAPPKGIDHG